MSALGHNIGPSGASVLDGIKRRFGRTAYAGVAVRGWNRETMMFCPRCGKETLGDETFCRFCGTGLMAPGSTTGITRAEQKSATGFVVGSAICAAVSLLFVPPLFGVAGIVLGYFAFRRNRLAGTICMIVSGVCMVVGVILSWWLWLWADGSIWESGGGAGEIYLLWH